MSIKKFLIQIIIMIIIVLILIFGALFWLKIYTNHGQKIELPDYVGAYFDEASQDAEDKSFTMIVNDSIHVVGESGGKILSQNPLAFSKVKENRKIYVTISKFAPDLISMEDLPAMYGRSYESKLRELGYSTLGGRIKSYKYDTGEPDHIMEVWYKDRKVISSSGRDKNFTIAKGDTLDFVLSKSSGGKMEIPDLKCMKMNAAEFLLSSSNLDIGIVKEEGEVTDRSNAYIIDQYPPYSLGTNIDMGSVLEITIQQNRPSYCR